MEGDVLVWPGIRGSQSGARFADKINEGDNPPFAQKREHFLQLLSPVKNHLYNYILKSLNFSFLGDDLYQDVLLKAFRYFEAYDNKRSFKTWIFAIAHNLIKDFYCKGINAADSIELKDIGCDDASVKHQVKEIYRLAEQLKPQQREVFFLFYDNEFKTAEIAQITGLSRANVKFTLIQARKTIQKILEVPNEKKR